MTTVATAAGGRNKDQRITGERRRGQCSARTTPSSLGSRDQSCSECFQSRVGSHLSRVGIFPPTSDISFREDCGDDLILETVLSLGGVLLEIELPRSSRS
jgi:hypothetical protein